MVTKDYKPDLKPRVDGDSIVLSREGLQALKITDPAAQATLQKALLTWWVYPEIYWFADTPEVRRALGMEEGKPNA